MTAAPLGIALVQLRFADLVFESLLQPTRALGRGGPIPRSEGSCAMGGSSMLTLDTKIEELAGMLANEAQQRVAKAVVTSLAACEDNGYPLTDVQNSPLLADLFWCFDGSSRRTQKRSGSPTSRP